VPDNLKMVRDRAVIFSYFIMPCVVNPVQSLQVVSDANVFFTMHHCCSQGKQGQQS